MNIFSNQLRPSEKEILTSMLSKLNAYRSGHTHFPSLVSTLGVGIDALIDCKKEFIEVLRDQWRILEEFNAVALDQDKLSPLQGNLDASEAIISDMTATIIKQLDQNQSNFQEP